MQNIKQIWIMTLMLHLFIIVCLWRFSLYYFNSPKLCVKNLNMTAVSVKTVINSTNKNMYKFLKTQKERTLLVQKNCEGIGLIHHNSFGRIIFDRADSLTYCPIYKAASTTWTAMLLEMRGVGGSKDANNIQALISRTFKHKLTQSSIIKTIQGTTKFTIVRHPFERLVSCYRDKFQYGNINFYYSQYGESMVKKYRRIPITLSRERKSQMLFDVRRRIMSKQRRALNLTGNLFANPIGPTFEEFAKYVVECSIDNEHWVPYYKHCQFCYIKYDFILKFETIQEDSTALLQYLKKSGAVSKQVKQRWDNPTTNGFTSSTVACKHFSQIDSTLLRKLISKYSMDFKLFDYSYEDYFKCIKRNNTL